MQEKIQKKRCCFWDNFVRIFRVKLSLIRRECFSSAVNVLTNSYKAFPTQFPPKWSVNMMTVLLSRSQQCLNPFTMLPVKGSCETGLTSKIISKYGNRKNWEKAFCFWDNCVRIGRVKLFLLRRECFSSAVNVLTNHYKALRLNNTDFFRLNYLQNDQ